VEYGKITLFSESPVTNGWLICNSGVPFSDPATNEWDGGGGRRSPAIPSLAENDEIGRGAGITIQGVVGAG